MVDEPTVRLPAMKRCSVAYVTPESLATRYKVSPHFRISSRKVSDRAGSFFFLPTAGPPVM